MRRFIVVYWSFAITFALGFAAVSVFLGFYFVDERPPVLPTTSESQTLNASTFDEKPLSIDQKFTCNDASLRPFWNILSKQSAFDDLEELHNWLAPDDTNRKYDCSYFFRIDQFRDLNGDGRKEAFVDGIDGPFCDMSADCANFVFELVGGKYRLILYQPHDISYRVMSRSTNGYFDLEYRTNDRLGECNVWLYKFNGKAYRLSRSKRYISKEFRNGEIKTYQPPKVSPLKCTDKPPKKLRDLECDY